jgi:hypothetical protein
MLIQPTPTELITTRYMVFTGRLPRLGPQHHKILPMEVSYTRALSPVPSRALLPIVEL